MSIASFAWDYIFWRLHQYPISPDFEQICFKDWPKSTSLPDEHCLDFRALVFKFEKSYRNCLVEMSFDMADVNVPDFMNVARRVFEKGNINWGRIFALFAICGVLAAGALRPYRVHRLTQLLAFYCEIHLTRWVEAHINELSDYAFVTYFGCKK